MDKFEMAKKLYDLADKNGRVKLEDFAKLVFDSKTPKEIVDNFMKHADKLAESENLWNDVGRLAKTIKEKQSELKNVETEFNEKYQRLKAVTKELGMDDYINLPD